MINIYKAIKALQYLIERPLGKGHQNRDSDYEDFIKSIGDYCVERVREDHKGDVYFVVDWMAMRGVIKDKMDEHLKECHPFKDESKKVAPLKNENGIIQIDASGIDDGDEMVIKRSDGKIYFEIRRWQ